MDHFHYENQWGSHVSSDSISYTIKGVETPFIFISLSNFGTNPIFYKINGKINQEDYRLFSYVSVPFWYDIAA